MKTLEGNDLLRASAILAEGVNPNYLGKMDMRPLFWFALHGNYQAFEFLLENGAEPNVVAKIEIKQKMHPDRPEFKSLPLMELLAPIADSRFLESALKHGGDPDTKVQSSVIGGLPIIFAAIDSGNIENVGLLIDSGSDIDFTHSLTSPLIRSNCRSVYDG